jgi:hypothetical protein
MFPDEESVFEVKRLVTERLVVVAESTVSAPMKEERKVEPVAERLVVLALVEVKALMNPEEKERPLPEISLVDAVESVVAPVTESVPPTVVEASEAVPVA